MIAYSINDHNYVVGTSRVPDTLVDNIGSWVLTVATGINNRGEIVGVGMRSASKPAELDAWLLTPLVA